MRIDILQANINRSGPFLGLLVHQARESGVGLLLVSEPNYIPDTENWFASGDGSAAIFVDPSIVRMRCQLAGIGSNFVALDCGPYKIVSTYIPPRYGQREFNNTLHDLSGVLSSRLDNIIIGGDFNAKARLWGANSTDGSSIVDLTWVSPDILAKIRDWRVRDDLESLSDHQYISYSVHTDRPSAPLNRTASRKWNIKRFDKDLFLADLTWRGHGPGAEDRQDVQRMTNWLDRVMEEACDVAASRIGPRKPRRQAYWWQDSAAILRQRCIHARRLWQRAKKRKNRPQEVIDELGADFKRKRKDLRIEINRLKSAAWQELIDSINGDPWGLPYRIVLRKLRSATPGMTELLDSEKLLDSLFSRNNLPDPIEDWAGFE
ncbi:uncharacterized protein [Polyergus mexicanus]|uniref:uncharacterized protein n=1 Tax=Polyergus mexicanus TaxID=615972 RepID=UPI0038B5D85D